MDSIPFAFCDAVVGTIRKLPQLKVPFRDAKWNKALQDHSANRKCFHCIFGYFDGKWSYSMFNSKAGSNVLLTTVLQQVGPNYLRIDHIQCVGGWIGRETSKDKLHALIRNLKPFLNFPDWIFRDLYLKCPEKDVAELLLAFAEINICSFYSSRNTPSVMEFAKKLIREDTLLKEITLHGAQDLLADEIADYQATGRVVHVETEYFRSHKTSLQFVR